MTGNFGKPNATGRSSGKLSGRARKLRSAPPGEPFAILTRELLASPAVRALSLTGRRLLDFLLIEDMNHAGTENGNLIATYRQLTAFGLNGNLISGAIAELKFLGLVRVLHGGMTRGNVKRENLYRLTFYADSEGRPATNEWKGTDAAAVAAWKAKRRGSRS